MQELSQHHDNAGGRAKVFKGHCAKKIVKIWIHSDERRELSEIPLILRALGTAFERNQGNRILELAEQFPEYEKLLTFIQKTVQGYRVRNCGIFNEARPASPTLVLNLF